MSSTSNDITAFQKQKAFEKEYLFLREKEGRLYSDDVVAQLPFVTNDHPLKKEWQIRKRSGDQLINYLTKKKRPLTILEIGCGNGWLSSCLASITGAKVTGLDINRTELEQARRVFQKANLQFVLGDIRNGLVKGEFDAIIFAASLQYFKPLEETINACFQHLKPGGEIHVLDTQFYSESGQVEARKRSEDYFKKLASVAMQEYYFHHSLRDLEPFRYKVLFNPSSFFNKVFKAGPFPWICITK